MERQEQVHRMVVEVAAVVTMEPRLLALEEEAITVVEAAVDVQIRAVEALAERQYMVELAVQVEVTVVRHLLEQLPAVVAVGQKTRIQVRAR
jgi:hypothetical protein